jgi:translation initiation factor IF-3
MNEQIRVPEVRVLDEGNRNLGIMSTREALSKAQSLGLDLIMVAEKAHPPTCKIIDYGKYKYAESKKEKSSGGNATETKVLRMTVGTGEGDLTIKAKQASAWIKEGHRVKIELKLRGRSNAIDQNFLKERLQRVLILITEEYKVAEDIKKIPNGMIMVIEKGKKAA